MWRNFSLNRSTAPLALHLLCLGLALPAYAQDVVGYIEIRAPRDTVVAARTLQLRAVAATEFGRTLPDFTPRWRSSDSSVAAVNQSGTVSGVAPGLADIEAADSDTGVSDRITVRVYPARVEITPDNPRIEIGEQKAVSARALDADGRAIAGVKFVWRSGLPGIAAIDPAGNLRGVSEGATTIAALLDVGARNYQFSGQALVRVRRRADFATARLVASDQESSPVTLADIPGGNGFAGSGDFIAFIGSLSNGSRTLMLYQNGNLRRLATTGEYLEAAGYVIRNMYTVSVNSGGDVLVRMDFGNCNDAYVLFRQGKADPVLPGCGSSVAVLGEHGEVAYASYGSGSQDLRLRRPDGTTQMLLRYGESLPGFGPAQNINGVATTALGHVIFGVWDNRGGNGIFLWDGTKIEKLAAINDTLLGLRLTNVFTAVETSNGDIFMRVNNNDIGEQRIVRRSGGVWSTLVGNNTPPLPDGVNIYNGALAASGDTLLFPTSSGQGHAFYGWQQSRFERVALADNPCEFYAAPQGALVYRQCSGTRIVRATLSGTPTIVGTAFTLPAPATTSIWWDDLKLGGSGANLVTRSVADGIVRIGASVESVIAPGQPMHAGSTLAGVRFAGASGAGDFVFQADLNNLNGGRALYVWRNGKANVLADTAGTYFTELGQRVAYFDCCAQRLSINRRNQVVAIAGWNVDGLLLFTEGSTTARVVMETGKLGFINGVALDDSGRVMFAVPGGAYLYDSGQLTKTLTFNAPDSRGIRLWNISNLVAAGDRFFAIGNYENSPQLLLEYSGGSWRQVSVTALGAFSVNGGGDLVVVARLSNGLGVVLRKADGSEKVVVSTAEPTAEGEWLLDIYSAVINDAGEIYFTARTATGPKDRISLFRAVSR